MVASSYKQTNHVTMTLSNHGGRVNYGGVDADNVSDKSKKSYAKTSSIRQHESSDDDERNLIDGPSFSTA